MKFTKMHGLGNDYVYINCFKETVTNPRELAVKMSSRHFGIGADGLILIRPSVQADCRMEIYNADGSEAEMCGNGIRCVGKYVYEYGIVKKPEIFVETKAGIKRLWLKTNRGRVTEVTVNMGRPEWMKGEAAKQSVEVLGRHFCINRISMGNPHGVIFEKNWDRNMVRAYGPTLECHPIFPERCNIEFAEIRDRTHIRVGVWERGSGETLACGSGACAVLAAAVLKQEAERKAEIILPGGTLIAEWSSLDNSIYLTGAAEMVFYGEYIVMSE